MEVQTPLCLYRSNPPPARHLGVYVSRKEIKVKTLQDVRKTMAKQKKLTSNIKHYPKPKQLGAWTIESATEEEIEEFKKHMLPAGREITAQKGK